MHDRISPDRHSFEFDQIEPLRPEVDRAVLRLIAEETFTRADFVMQSDGVCRLNQELARRVAYASYRLIPCWLTQRRSRFSQTK
jgi:CRISP-associated protein Cas1